MNTDRPEVLDETRMSNSFLGRLLQVCVVTSDHRRTLEAFVALGIGPWSIRTINETNTSETTYRGRPARFSMKVCLANTDKMNWEVIEPLQGPSIYRDFLDRRGDGVQHLAFNCGGIAYEQQLAALRDRGYELAQSGIIGDAVRFHYWATDTDGLPMIEVYDFPQGASFPAIEEWYPARPPG